MQREKICICRLVEVLSSQITKVIGPANRKSAKCRNCERAANLTNYLSPQIGDFACCGSYLWKLFVEKYIFNSVPFKKDTL